MGYLCYSVLGHSKMVFFNLYVEFRNYIVVYFPSLSFVVTVSTPAHIYHQVLWILLSVTAVLRLPGSPFFQVEHRSTWFHSWILIFHLRSLRGDIETCRYLLYLLQDQLKLLSVEYKVHDAVSLPGALLLFTLLGGTSVSAFLPGSLSPSTISLSRQKFMECLANTHLFRLSSIPTFSEAFSISFPPGVESPAHFSTLCPVHTFTMASWLSDFIYIPVSPTGL